MTRRFAPRKTADQLRAEAAELYETMAQQAEQLRTSEGWKAYLAMAASFHPYSVRNILLIWAQLPTASQVAGYRQWQARGRQVRKGEKAIKIVGYSSKKITEEDPETGEEREHKVPRFPILSVFDISQTDQIEGQPDYTTPAHRLTGADDRGISDAVAEWLTGEGWTIIHRPMSYHHNGSTFPETRTVALAEGRAAAQEAKTLLHEAAHIVLGHIDDIDEYKAHRGRMECEAEAAAHIAAAILGLDTSSYSIGYVATWGDQETVKDAAAGALTAARAIVAALAGEEEEAESAA